MERFFSSFLTCATCTSTSSFFHPLVLVKSLIEKPSRPSTKLARLNKPTSFYKEADNGHVSQNSPQPNFFNPTLSSPASFSSTDKILALEKGKERENKKGGTTHQHLIFGPRANRAREELVPNVGEAGFFQPTRQLRRGLRLDAERAHALG